MPAKRKRKKIVRMSASTLAKRKAAYARKHGTAEDRRRKLDVAAYLAFEKKDGRIPRTLRKRRGSFGREFVYLKGGKYVMSMPPGVTRDPESGKFMSARDAGSSPAYRAEKRRVKRVKAKKSKSTIKELSARRAHRTRIWGRAMGI